MKIKILRSVAGSGISLKEGQEVDTKDLPDKLGESLLKSGMAEKVETTKRNTKLKGKKTAS